MAEISCGEYVLSPSLTRRSPLSAALSWYGTSCLSCSNVGSANLRPINRLIDEIVLSGLVMAWRLATWPTIRSPVFGLTATTDGVRRAPSALGITTGSPPSMTAMTELVVPRSIPITFGMLFSPLVGVWCRPHFHQGRPEHAVV